jgi:hypothetical protein
MQMTFDGVSHGLVFDYNFIFFRLAIYLVWVSLDKAFSWFGLEKKKNA